MSGERKKAAVAMSGGVDSSAALLLLRDSCDVIGVTLKLHNEELENPGGKTCCSLADTQDAAQVAARFGIPHYVYNMTELFGKKVIDNFVGSYENGFTPNPCIDCNRFIKFEALLERVRALGCDYVATGHYARIEYDHERRRYLLKKAVTDEGGGNDKDQSYVLYDLTQEQLEHTLFPLGGMSKARVRELARANGLLNAEKAESQDICFVPDGDYAAFIKKRTGREYPPGDILDTAGNKVGRHNGLINYTIGQRKGLGIAFGFPAYIVSKDIKTNTLVIGGAEDLLSGVLTAGQLNWIAFEKPEKSFRCKAKTRYRMKEQPCTVYPLEGGKVRVEFDEKQRAVTPGQRVVFYDGDVVVGGGVIL